MEVELLFNPCDEFRGPVSQIDLPPRWCPWDLFRSFKVCSDAKERERERERVGSGKHREATAPIHPW